MECIKQYDDDNHVHPLDKLFEPRFHDEFMILHETELLSFSLYLPLALTLVKG